MKLKDITIQRIEVESKGNNLYGIEIHSLDRNLKKTKVRREWSVPDNNVDGSNTLIETLIKITLETLDDSGFYYVNPLDRLQPK